MDFRRNANVQRGLALLIVLILILGLLGSYQNSQQNAGATATSGPAQPTALVFPTVPPGGTVVNVSRIYVHSSGVLSIPFVDGWDLAPNGAEEKLEPTSNSKITRAGVTFINSTALSVIHAFVELDPDRAAKTVQDLNTFYDKNNLDAAWANYKGGWKELNRGVNGDSFVINFELYLEGSTYLARQISRLENNWLVVLRLVAPNNNPQLIDQLNNVVWPKYKFWATAADTSLNWGIVADNVMGYVVKYPPDWKVIDGSSGRPYTVKGQINTDGITMTTAAFPGQTATTDDQARAWVKATRPNSTIIASKPENHAGVSGFSIAYSDPDADGNQRSATATLLNGSNGTLYTMVILTTAHGLNLLDETNPAVWPDLARVRNSMFLIPADMLVATQTPTITPTPSVTPTPTETPPVSATPLPTATVPATAIPPTAAPVVPSATSDISF